jgi:hypothetical protein
MIYCHLCGSLIENKELDKHYKITLGNLFSGKFYGKEVVYCHKECLNTINKQKKELLSEVY